MKNNWLNVEELKIKRNELAKTLYSEEQLLFAPSIICYEAWKDYNMKTRKFLKIADKIVIMLNKLQIEGYQCFYCKGYIKRIKDGKTEFLKLTM